MKKDKDKNNLPHKDKRVLAEMKDDISELLKPIAVHEAKSALYKAKLAGYVLKKGAEGIKFGASVAGKKAAHILEERRIKKLQATPETNESKRTSKHK